MRVRTIRERGGWTQEAVAERAGLHPTYLSSVERGMRNVGLLNLLALAMALDVEPGQLVNGLR